MHANGCSIKLFSEDHKWPSETFNDHNNLDMLKRTVILNDLPKGNNNLCWSAIWQVSVWVSDSPQAGTAEKETERESERKIEIREMCIMRWICIVIEADGS